MIVRPDSTEGEGKFDDVQKLMRMCGRTILLSRVDEDPRTRNKHHAGEGFLL